MKILRGKAPAAGLAVAVTLGMVSVPAAPAQAATTLPAAPVTCASGETKLDYQYMVKSTLQVVWSNVCGTGTWNWDYTDDYLTEVRMPTSPYHRIWTHQYADGSGWSACYYSEDSDVGIYQVVGGNTYEEPGNIQVSDNTTAC